MISRKLIAFFIFLVVATALLLVFLFLRHEDKSVQEENKVRLRNEVYSHLDKLCRDVNSLDKIQIAIYFMMQSWLRMCDTTPNTISWAPLKIMKKKIHDAITKKIHEFHAQEERTVEDCIIEYYKTEINRTKDDFHQLLFELVLQGYVNTFNGGVTDETGKLLKMQTVTCKNDTSCQYTFKNPPATSNALEIIIKKDIDYSGRKAVQVMEEKCVQIFHHLYLWNEKIREPEWFDWVYYLLFKGLKKQLNITDFELKQNLQCSSPKMEAMEEAMLTDDDVDPYIIMFLRERDNEIEVLEDEMEYASESEKETLEKEVNFQTVLAEILVNTYVSTFNVSPDNDKIIITSSSGKVFEVEIPPMEQSAFL